MGLPNIMINFKSSALSAVKRGQRGIVAIIIKDSAQNGVHVLENRNDIPEELNSANKSYIERAFLGGVNPVNKVIVYVLASEAEDYSAAFKYFETVKFDYIVGAHDMSTEKTAMVTWVKKMRDELDKKIKAVLPDSASDHEGIINFATSGIVAGETFSATQYCSRIAGLLAGTPLSIASTFTVLPEVTDVPRLTKAELDEAIDAGKFVLFHDGEKVKVARGVNSLTTTDNAKGEAFKKIKIIDIIDLIQSDIKKVANDTYIGKFANTYDNKCLLITAIKEYYEQLEVEGLLERGMSTIEIDMQAQKQYLKSVGVDTSSMSEYAIKSANTGDKVFLASAIKPIDAIEEITLNVTI